MEGNLLRATKDGQRGNKGCLLVVLLCLQSMATERHTAVSLSCRSTSGARDCLECSGADSGLASLLGPTGFHYAGPGATRATAHRSVILLLSPQKTNVDVRRDLDHSVTVAIGTLVETHRSILMITGTIRIGNDAQGPKWMLA